MRRMRFARLAVAASLAVSALVVTSAAKAENTCTKNTVIFSRNSAAPRAVNPNALLCIEDSLGDHTDTRWIVPGANEVSIRYTEDLGEDFLSVRVVLNGMGFNDTVVEAPRVAGTLPDSFWYQTLWVALPELSGAVTADIYLVEADSTLTLLDSTTFHTIDHQ